MAKSVIGGSSNGESSQSSTHPCQGSRAGFRGRDHSRPNSTRRAGYNGGGNSFTNNPGRGNCFYVEVNVSSIVKSVPASTDNTDNIVWLLDSGCSNHIFNDESYFENFTLLNKPIEVKLGDGKKLLATKLGNVRSSFKVEDRFISVDIQNVLFVKGMGSNLLSSGRITENNTIVEFGNVAEIFNFTRELIAIAHKRNNLYWLVSYK